MISFIISSFNYIKEGDDAFLSEFCFAFFINIIAISCSIYLYVFWLIPKFIDTKKYLSFVFFAIIILVFFASIDYLMNFWSRNNNWNEFPTGMSFVFKMINRGVVNASFPFAILVTKKFYEGQTDYLKIEKQQKENELKLLRSQIDPHFLFNNLDALIDSNPEKAKEYVNRLSLIYRYLIQTKDSEVMELSEELKLAENYLFLIETRFGKDYEFLIKERTAIDNTFVTTGAIQVLLENVVKHNKRVLEAIKTSVIIEGGYLKVVNTKSTIKSTNESFGMGLENLKERYKYLSNKKMNIISSDNEFIVFIPIINLSE